MLRLDVAGLTADVFNRLALDDAGEPVRLELGAGELGVLAAHQLEQLPPPAGPFIALRRYPIAAPPGGPIVATFLWYIYDDPGQGYARINALLRPLALAYDQSVSPLPRAHAAISAADLAAGEERHDSALGRPYVVATLTIYC